MAKDIKAAVKPISALQEDAVTETKEVEKMAAAPVTETVKAAKRFVVSLPHNPDREVEAVDAEDARQKYKEYYGIISTVHEFKVSALKGE